MVWCARALLGERVSDRHQLVERVEAVGFDEPLQHALPLVPDVVGFLDAQAPIVETFAGVVESDRDARIEMT